MAASIMQGEIPTTPIGNQVATLRYLGQPYTSAFLLQPNTPFCLTLSGLGNTLTSVVWTCDTFEDFFEIEHNFEKYLKESCR